MIFKNTLSLSCLFLFISTGSLAFGQIPDPRHSVLIINNADVTDDCECNDVEAPDQVDASLEVNRFYNTELTISDRSKNTDVDTSNQDSSN